MIHPPRSLSHLITEAVIVIVIGLFAFIQVLPTVDLFPFSHAFFGGWFLWRCHCNSRQLLCLHAWQTPTKAAPIVAKAHPKGVILGDGFEWVGDHALALQTYVLRYKSLPSDDNDRGGSPAIHGCGREHDRRVMVPYGRLRSHIALEGSTQCGKTNLLAKMVQQLISISDPALKGPVVIMDPKGSDELYVAVRDAAKQHHRKLALIRPRVPKESAAFNVISSCEESIDIPGRLAPLFPESQEAYFKDEPLGLLQRVAAMHKYLDIPLDIRDLHREVMHLHALKWRLLEYLKARGVNFPGSNPNRFPSAEKIFERCTECKLDDPLLPGILESLEFSQEEHKRRCGNLTTALSGIVDVPHAALFGTKDSLTWADIDRDSMVVVFRTDSLVTHHIGRNIASLFFQDFIGYMGLRYLNPARRRTPIYVIVDEVGEIVYPDFRHAINKVGEAGGRLVLAWQCESDLDARLGKYEANVIRANCQSRIAMRIADDDTAEALAKQSPRVRMHRVTANRASVGGLWGSKGVTVEDDEIPLLDANVLQGQPAGQCFLRLDGSLYHVNIPY